MPTRELSKIFLQNYDYMNILFGKNICVCCARLANIRWLISGRRLLVCFSKLVVENLYMENSFLEKKTFTSSMWETFQFWTWVLEKLNFRFLWEFFVSFFSTFFRGCEGQSIVGTKEGILKGSFETGQEHKRDQNRKISVFQKIKFANFDETSSENEPERVNSALKIFKCLPGCKKYLHQPIITNFITTIPLKIFFSSTSNELTTSISIQHQFKTFF